MNWQNSNDAFDEDQIPMALHDQQRKTKLIEETEQQKEILLKKFQDPDNNIERKACAALVTQFGDLLMKNNIEEMINTVLTTDCEFFLFNSARSSPALYSVDPKNLYKDIRVQERHTRETHVDLKKNTVAQFSNYKIKYEDKENATDEVAGEIFTIKNNKISKYIAFFGRMAPAHGDYDPFELSKREKALAVAKKISYALADQPDLNKVASYFHETTQFKVWSWETNKCFVFGKHDLAEKFKSLEENLVIKCIVPYEVYTEAQYVIATYVYHLEGRSGTYANKKYIWFCTSIYTFDEDLNILKICQQGELNEEGEVEIPFKIFSGEKIDKEMEEKLKKENFKGPADFFYHGLFQMTTRIYFFGHKGLPDSIFSQGLEKANQVVGELSKIKTDVEWEKKGDICMDCNDDPSYDIIIRLNCKQMTINYPGYKYNDQKLNSIFMAKACFENGKFLKLIVFNCEIPEPIPSPFDDPQMEGINIRKRD